MGLSYQITHNKSVMNQERTLTFGKYKGTHIEVILLEASQQVTSVV